MQQDTTTLHAALQQQPLHAAATQWLWAGIGLAIIGGALLLYSFRKDYLANRKKLQAGTE